MRGLKIAILGWAAMAWCALPAAAENEHAILAIPGQNILFLTHYVATDLHLWEQQGLDVKVLNIIGIGAMNAVIAGSAEFSMSSGPSITRAWGRGQKLIALATAIGQSGQDIVIRKDIADADHFDPAAALSVRAKILKGRIFAVGAIAAIPDIILRAVAKSAGIAPDQLTVTPMQPPEFMAAFARKAIDGFSNSPPFIQQVVQDGTGVIVSDATRGEPVEFSPVSASLLLARAGYCADHRSICTKMVHGVVEAGQFIRAHPAETLAVMKAHFGTYNDDVLRAAYEMVKAMTADLPLTSEADLKNGDRLNEAAGYIKPDEMLARYDVLIDNSFVK